MFNIGDTLTQAQINGVISLYCNLHYDVFSFDYTDEVINTPFCNLQILNGLYSDEELIIEDSLDVLITEQDEICNFYLKLKYYDYDADEDDRNSIMLKEDVFLIEDGKVNFNKMTYIMLDDWKLIVRYNKPFITYL